MTDIKDFTTRELDQEIDSIEFIPDHPDFMIVGTYSLQRQQAADDLDAEPLPSSTLRIGSLQILPLKAHPTSHQPTRHDVPYAVVDIHFHPAHKTLLGAATSVGLVDLFSVVAKHDHSDTVTTNFEITRICSVEAGTSLLSNPPLVTQFVWLTESEGNRAMDSSQAAHTLIFAACDSSGQSQIVQAQISHVSEGDGYHSTSEITEIHEQNYDLEAWCISDLRLYDNPSSTHHSILLSGGDDSTLIASSYIHHYDAPTSSLTINPQSKLFTDKSTHTAGVVAILPLPPPSPSKSNPTPLLSGSYDETLRLFHLDPSTPTRPPTLHASLSIPGGGVWKIALLDTYLVPDTTSTHYILLISAMHAGARVVRLAHTSSPPPPPLQEASHSENDKWTFRIEASFSRGHGSMVYACVAREIMVGGGEWIVVSTSFYDKKVCVWGWADGVKKNMVAGQEGVS